MPRFPDPSGDREWPIYTATVVVALLLPVYWMVGPESRLRPEEIGRAVALQDTLERYLRPVPAEGVVPAGEGEISPTETVSGRPASDPFRFGSEPRTSARAPTGSPSRPEEDGRDRWRVSAILTMGGEHVAIVNDTPVRPGDLLPGGVEVTSVTSDRVVLTRPDGGRVVLPF